MITTAQPARMADSATAALANASEKPVIKTTALIAIVALVQNNLGVFAGRFING